MITSSGSASPRVISYDKLTELGFRRNKAGLVLLGIDPSGEGDDRTGLVINERMELELGEPHDQKYAVEHAYVIRHAERLDRDLEFPDVMSLMLAYHKKMLQKPKSVSGHRFIIEVNGVGYGFAAMLAKLTGPGYVIPIFTTAGTDNACYTSEGRPKMPRMAGLDNFRMMTQLQRITISDKAKGTDNLVKEMRTFIQRGRRPEAAPGAHDDLVMATCTTVWAGTRLIPPRARAKRYH